MNKFFNFKKVEDFDLNIYLFLYVAVINTVLLLCSEMLETVGYRSWAFFMTSIIYFIFPEESAIPKIIKLGVGGIVGCLLSYCTIMLYIGPLASLHTWGIIIPILVCVGFVFLLEPFAPVFFNVSTFAYFTVSFVIAEEAVFNVWTNIIWTCIGTLVMCGGYAIILKIYNKAK